MDFSLNMFANLLGKILIKGFSFLTFADYIEQMISENYSSDRYIIMRHDVDLKPQNALTIATIERKLGIKGSYYFRIPVSYDVDIIKQIVDMGHEVGYHYETMDTVSKKLKLKRKKIDEKVKEDLIDVAYIEFCENLEKLRKIYPVKTICMHGSPKSAFDNREIWKKYDYKQLGIIGEPYFDINFNDFFYLTDTGRCWNGYNFSVRDKIPQQKQWVNQGLVFKTTIDIINAIKADVLPSKIMITVHPQRWTDNKYLWWKEYIMQNIKNCIKRMIILFRSY